MSDQPSATRRAGRGRGTPALIIVLYLAVIPLLVSLTLTGQRLLDLQQQREDLAAIKASGDRLAAIGSARALLSDERNGIGLIEVAGSAGFNVVEGPLLLGFDLQAELTEISSQTEELLEAVAPGLSAEAPYAERAGAEDLALDDLNDLYRRIDADLARRGNEETARLWALTRSAAVVDVDPAVDRLEAAVEAHWRLAQMASAYMSVLSPDVSLSPEADLTFLYDHRLRYDDLTAHIGTDASSEPAVRTVLNSIDTTLATIGEDGLAAVRLDPLAESELQPEAVSAVVSFEAASAVHRDLTIANRNELAMAIDVADADAARAVRLSMALSLGMVVASAAAVTLATSAVVQPLRRLAEGAGRLSDGEVGLYVNEGGVREVRQAIEALNRASAGIAMAQKRTRALAEGDGHTTAMPVGPPPSVAAIDDDGLGASVAASFDALESVLADRERLRRRLEHEASHDALTGLLNRRGLRQELDERLGDGRSRPADAGHGGETTGLLVLYLDLDGFKAVNDRHGHEAGDEVLRAVASRLRTLTPTDALVARMGGDEFIVVVPDTTTTQGHAIGAAVTSQLDRPIEGTSGQLDIGASVGFHCAPATVDDVEAMIRLADAATFYAKASKLDTAVAYSDEVGAWMAARAAESGEG